MVDLRRELRTRQLGATVLLLALSVLTLPAAEPADGAHVRGRITDEAGEPVGGATVRVLRQGLSAWSRETQFAIWSGPRSATTGDDGTFEVRGLDGDEFAVRVEREGLAPTTIAGIPAGAWLTLHLAAGHALRGLVIAEGSESAVAGATVVACDADGLAFGREACRRVRSAKDGGFVLDGLPAGQVLLRAHAAGFAVSRVQSLELPIAAGTPPTTLQLRPGARVAGRVIDERERPVAAARVFARPLARAGGGPAGDDRAWPVHSDDDGAFEIEGLAAGTRFGLFAYRSDRGVAAGDALAVRPGEDVEGLAILLPTSAAVTLRLVDENGAAVPDFEIYYRDSSGTPGDYLGPVEPDRIERGGEGRITARISRYGTLDLRIVPRDLEEIEVAEVALEPGGTTDLATLVARSGLAIRGRVTDSDGAPVAWARVEASWSEGGLPRSRRALADEEGHYAVIGLPEIAVRLEATAAGFVATALDDVEVPASEVDLRLQSSGGLAGTVELEEGGAPTAFMVVVHVEADSEIDAADLYDGFPRKESFSGEEGAYRIDDLPPGRYTVEARAMGRAPGRRTGVQVEHGEITELETIELGRGLVLEGLVVAGGDEAPLAGASVEVRREGGSIVGVLYGQRHAAGSDEEGRFHLEGLEPGAHVVRASHPDFAPAEERVELAVGDEPEEVVLRLSAGGTLTGTVRDADGNAASGRRVGVTRAGHELLDATVTDGDGRYELLRLPPGAYTVNLIPAPGTPFRMKAKRAVIREGEVTLLDFDESSPITLRGSVYRDGEPLGHARLFFAKAVSLSDFKFSTTDADGRYEVGLDEPGRYRVLVQAGTTNTAGGASAEITVPEAEQVRQDIYLGSDGIEGRVLDADGNPVAGAVVAVSGGPATTAALLVSETGPEGRYSIQGLHPGVYRLSATAHGFKIGVVHGVELAEGSGAVSVEIRLERGETLSGRLVDDFGGPIPGAPVLVAPAGSVDPWGTAAATALTDVNGAFRVTLPADGPLDVTALPSGRAPARLLGVLPTEREGDLVLRATRGGTLRIRVVDGEDRPRQGVTATAQPDPPFVGSAIAALLSPPSPTDAGGMTVIANLAPGSYRVTIPGRDDLSPATVTVAEGSETLVQLELP